MQNKKRIPKSIPTVAVLLAIPGLVLSQLPPFDNYASILWLSSGALMLIALTFAIRNYRISKAK